MNKPVVVVTELEYRKGQAVFTPAEDLEIIPGPADEDALANLVGEKKAFAVIAGVDKYQGPLYRALPPGGLIARFGVGYDGVDLKQAAEKGVLVANTPGTLDTAVAEHTVFLAGAVLRKIGRSDRKMRQSGWEAQVGLELQGKIWLIVGLGAIGKMVSRIVSAGFNGRVFACEPLPVDAAEARQKYGVEKVSADFRELAPAADIVSLHLPSSRETYHYLDAEKLRLLKPSAVLVNTSRGPLVDENALYQALSSGRLSAAALDVFETEPYRPIDPEQDLRRLDNTVLTCHIASSTVEACRRMAERALHNVRCCLKKEYGLMDLLKPR